MVGRCLDLVGTELPFQPFVDALRPHVPALPWMDGQAANSQLRVFEDTLALLTGRAEQRPLLLVLEDLHWADSSTLDLVVFLAHNLDERRALLVATYPRGRPGIGRAHGAAQGGRPTFRLGSRARPRAARP